MAYADHSQGSSRTISIVIVALIHAVLGYAFVTGLGMKYVKKAAEQLNVIDVKEEPPPPDEEPPPPPPDKPIEPPPVVAPPPIVQTPAPAPPIQTVRTPPPVSMRFRSPHRRRHPRRRPPQSRLQRVCSRVVIRVPGQPRKTILRALCVKKSRGPLVSVLKWVPMAVSRAAALRSRVARLNWTTQLVSWFPAARALAPRKMTRVTRSRRPTRTAFSGGSRSNLNGRAGARRRPPLS